MGVGWRRFGRAARTGLSALDCVRNILLIFVIAFLAVGAETATFETAVVPVLKAGVFLAIITGFIRAG